MNNLVEAQSDPTPWLGLVRVEADVQVGSFEPFVDEQVVARFLQITPRRVLDMARKKQIPAHPIGDTRKTWRFRMSEIDGHFSEPVVKRPGARMTLAVPGTHERKKHG
jgi:hypothetical protein